MLSKLLKYEIKASARTLIPLYLGILVVSIVCGFLLTNSFGGHNFNGNTSFFSGMLTLLLFGLFVALGVLTIVSIIQRFNQSLLGDEGFLMFTLPISSAVLLSSKLIVAMLWTICGGIITLLSSAIIFGITIIRMPFSFDFWEEASQFFSLIDAHDVSVVFQVLLLIFLSLVATILTAYLSMMIGQLQIFSNHRVPVSFIAFFIINWIISWFSQPINNIFDHIDVTITSGLLTGNIFGIVIAAILFFLVNYLMNKKLNL